MRERFAELRAMGIRTVMITGDNPLTAKAIAAEAGVDDFLAEATPEDKMALIREQAGRPPGRDDRRRHQRRPGAGAGRRRRGDEHRHLQAAKEAGNMVDLDSDPTKLIEIVEIGKQLLITRGLAHHLLDRQRRRQVLRDHPGDVRRRVPRARHVLNIMGCTRPHRRSCRRSSSTPWSSSPSSRWRCEA
jgi:hypothetical protein